MKLSSKDTIIIGLLITVCAMAVLMFFTRNENSDSSAAANFASQNFLHQPTDPSGRGKPGKTPYEMNQVKNTIAKNTKSIRECYLNFMETKPEITDGKVTIDWQIARDGEVLISEIVSSELGSDSLHSCMTSTVKSWQFPPTGVSDPVYTSFTFVFKKDEETEENKK